MFWILKDPVCETLRVCMWLYVSMRVKCMCVWVCACMSVLYSSAWIDELTPGLHVPCICRNSTLSVRKLNLSLCTAADCFHHGIIDFMHIWYSHERWPLCKKKKEKHLYKKLCILLAGYSRATAPAISGFIMRDCLCASSQACVCASHVRSEKKRDHFLLKKMPGKGT